MIKMVWCKSCNKEVGMPVKGKKGKHWICPVCNRWVKTPPGESSSPSSDQTQMPVHAIPFVPPPQPQHQPQQNPQNPYQYPYGYFGESMSHEVKKKREEIELIRLEQQKQKLEASEEEAEPSPMTADQMIEQEHKRTLIEKIKKGDTEDPFKMMLMQQMMNKNQTNPEVAQLQMQISNLENKLERALAQKNDGLDTKTLALLLSRNSSDEVLRKIEDARTEKSGELEKMKLQLEQEREKRIENQIQDLKDRMKGGKESGLRKKMTDKMEEIAIKSFEDAINSPGGKDKGENELITSFLEGIVERIEGPILGPLGQAAADRVRYGGQPKQIQQEQQFPQEQQPPTIVTPPDISQDVGIPPLPDIGGSPTLPVDPSTLQPLPQKPLQDESEKK